MNAPAVTHDCLQSNSGSTVGVRTYGTDNPYTEHYKKNSNFKLICTTTKNYS